MAIKSYAAVIVTYNRKDKLKKAIECLKKQIFKPEKIIIIDNASTDGTQVVLEDYKDDDLIKYVRLEDNLGGAGGFYYGVKEALNYDVDYLALSDDDAWYQEDYFENMQKTSEIHPDVKAFIGMSKDINTGDYVKQGADVVDWNTLELRETQREFCDTVTFCGFVISKEIVEKIGLPRKDFFIWQDDREYGLRAGKETKIEFVKDAILLHNEKRDHNGLIPVWKNYYGFRNSIVLRQLYAKDKKAAKSYALKQLLRHVSAVLIKKEYKGKRKIYIQSYTDGYKDGYSGNMGKNQKFLPGM